MYWSVEAAGALVVGGVGGVGGEERLTQLLKRASERPGAHLHIFTRRWADVDGLRAKVEAAGVSDRVSIHHGAALAALGNPAAA